MKNQIIRAFLCAALGALALYAGISCTATLHKALTQPCLTAGAERYVFMGYYMIAAACGAICLSAFGVLIAALAPKKKRRK